jgi:hypothetical protein
MFIYQICLIKCKTAYFCQQLPALLWMIMDWVLLQKALMWCTCVIFLSEYYEERRRFGIRSADGYGVIEPPRYSPGGAIKVRFAVRSPGDKPIRAYQYGAQA